MLTSQKAAVIIQRCWRSFSDKTIFRFYRSLLSNVSSLSPSMVLRSISPTEARLLDKSTFCHVRFRLSGFSFPPMLLYRVYVHGNVTDLNSFAPRDYSNRLTSSVPAEKVTDKSGWYNRDDLALNPWRPVAETALTDLLGLTDLTLPLALNKTKPPESWHWSKLKRSQDVEKKRRLKRLEWLKKTYSNPSKKQTQITDDDDFASLNDWVQELDFDDYLNSWSTLSVSTVDL
ncbi:hypothetical protein RCL1_005202 [Eukaryota sp. TZLM3-RCL]